MAISSTRPSVDGWASYPLVVRFADASSGKPAATAEDVRTSSWRPIDSRSTSARRPRRPRAGILLHDGKMTRGTLSAGIADAVDVYRFRLRGRATRRYGRGGRRLQTSCSWPDRHHDRLRLRGYDQFDDRETARPRDLLRGRPRPPGLDWPLPRLRPPANADDRRGQVGRRRSGPRDCKGNGLAGRRWARHFRAAAVRPAQRLALLALDETVAPVGHGLDGCPSPAGPVADQSAVHREPRREPEHEQLGGDLREVSRVGDGVTLGGSRGGTCQRWLGRRRRTPHELA